MVKYDLLVYLGLIPIVSTFIFGAFVIWVTPASVGLEVRRIRFADGMLGGLAALFIFAAILYFVDEGGAGKEIFDKSSTAILALLGTIMGYIFGTTKA